MNRMPIGMAVATLAPIVLPVSPVLNSAEAVDVECTDLVASLTPTTPPALVVGAGQSAAQSSSECNYHFGCFEPNTAARDWCSHSGATYYSWIAFGGYYCPLPADVGGGGCQYDGAVTTDGSWTVRVRADGNTADLVTYTYVTGQYAGQNDYSGSSDAANEVHASSYFGSLSGAFGGWLRDSE